jgi:hypothetical protein
VEISTKPWETVFEGLSEIIAGPRDPEKPTAPAIEAADEIEDADEIEIIDADIEINAYEIDDLTRVEQVSQSAGYTDAPMDPAPTTPVQAVRQPASRTAPASDR